MARTAFQTAIINPSNWRAGHGIAHSPVGKDIDPTHESKHFQWLRLRNRSILHPPALVDIKSGIRARTQQGRTAFVGIGKAKKKAKWIRHVSLSLLCVV
jgi:hypothetical protein